MKSLFVGIILTITTLLFSAQAHATDIAVELQLMIDTSGSIDPTEFQTQIDGYEAAFRSTLVQNAIAAAGSIVVSVAYFSTTADSTMGTGISMNPQIDWMRISSNPGMGEISASAFADLISMLSPTDSDGSGQGETNIAAAIEFGIAAFDNDFVGDRLVIDVSTDGVQNLNLAGTSNACVLSAPYCTDIVETQRGFAMADDITVNAIAINPDDIDEEIPQALIEQFDEFLISRGLPTIEDGAGIDDYLREFVITDDGFVETALFGDDMTPSTFAESITRKLAREINPIPLPAAFWLFGSALGFILIRQRF